MGYMDPVPASGPPRPLPDGQGYSEYQAVKATQMVGGAVMGKVNWIMSPG